MKNCDIAIIGNGIIGYSLCYALLQQDQNLKIAIIGKKTRPGSASTAAGAMLNCFAEITSLSLQSETAKSLFDICIKSLRLWPQWIEQIKEQSGHNNLKINFGTFVIHNSKSGNLDTTHYHSIIDALNSYDEPYEKVAPKSILGFNPIDDCRALDAIYLPNEGYLNPEELLSAFETIFEKSGRVKLIDDFAMSITNNNGSFTVKNTESTIEAEQVVIAAGCYSQQLLDNFPDIAKKIPKILSGVGYSVIMEQDSTNQIEHVIRTPNRAGACGLHALPVNNSNNLYVGATNNVFAQPEELTKAALSNFLVECALEQINQELYKSRIVKWNIGNRPVSLDGYPLIGETSISGLWLISGTYRDGFHKSPFISQHLANEILGKKGLLDHNLFTPERKFIRGMTKEESIAETSEHFMSGSYEWGMKLPKIGYDPLFRKYIKERMEGIYDKLDIDFGLTPDLMIMFHFAENQQKLANFFNEAVRHIKQKEQVTAYLS